MPPHDQHYSKDYFYNKNGYYELRRRFEKQKRYYRDSLIVQHHRKKYNGKMPLWVIVEMMSFSSLSMLYSAMYNGDKDYIAGNIGTGKSVLENHLHCLTLLRNRCAHGARLYNAPFNLPVQFSSGFLRRNPDVKTNCLFAYCLMLARRLPNKEAKMLFINDLSSLIRKYRHEVYIDLNMIGFPADFEARLKQNS